MLCSEDHNEVRGFRVPATSAQRWATNLKLFRRNYKQRPGSFIFVRGKSKYKNETHQQV